MYVCVYIYIYIYVYINVHEASPLTESALAQHASTDDKSKSRCVVSILSLF